MLRKVALVIADILKENKIAVPDLIKILERCLGTINIIKDITNKDTKYIKVIADTIEAFIRILEVIKSFEEGNK